MSGRVHWRERAACLGLPVLLFVPDDEDDDTTFARGVCADCPVKTPCLHDALPFGDVGIRGGMDERERRRIVLYGTRLPKGALDRRIEEATDSPDDWVLVAEFTAEHTATTYASQFKTGARSAPPGAWLFEGRPDGCGGSELWVRYAGCAEIDGDQIEG